jgi:hypothetical protein
MDRKAIIAAVAVVGLVLTGAIGWEARTRTTAASRSLTAAPPRPAAAAQPQVHSLHVEGCKEDFLVQVGELVEPRVTPGASLPQFRQVYGPETRREKAQTLWVSYPFTLTEIPGTEPAVHLAVNTGHVVETLDGIELGIDSFATIRHKMRDKKVEIDEAVTGDGQHWTLTTTLSSACGRRFLSQYSRTLEATDEVNRAVAAVPGPDGKPGPLRPDVFLNKVVYEYTLKAADRQAAGH